jgi:hypothetical protein
MGILVSSFIRFLYAYSGLSTFISSFIGFLYAYSGLSTFISSSIGFLDVHSGFSTFISSFIVAAITSVYVVFTWYMLQESKKMRLLQSQPSVSITTEPEGSGPISLIDLVIKNIGLGPAYDLRFKYKPDIEIIDGALLSEVGLIKDGIPYLAPQQEFKILLTNLYGASKEKKEQPLSITVQYRDSLNTPYTRTFVINFTIYYGMLR